MHSPHAHELATSAAYPPDRHYWLRMVGFLHASYRINSVNTARQQVVILLSGCGRPFRLRAQGLDVMTDAALVGPQVMRSLHAVGVELLAFHVAPGQPAFAALSLLSGGGIKLLQREQLRPWYTALREAVWGTPHIAAVHQLIDEIVQAVQRAHGVIATPDASLTVVHQALDRDFERPLAELAREVGLSSTRLSRLFNDRLGLPLRSYQAWRRTAVAWELFAFRTDLSLTQVAHEAGYSDSAHMSRTWHRLYGVSPSYMRSQQVWSFR